MNVLPPNAYDGIVQVLMNRIEHLLDLPQKEEMNELVENLFMLKPIQPDTVTRITEWTKLKPSDHAGLNYKILFRLMDIVK